jgi:hypothetical protein
MEMGRPVEEVQTVIAFYYKTLRQKLSGLESVNIQVENLGTFYIKERALNKYIISSEKYKETLSDINIREYETKLNVQKRIDAMKNIVELLAKEKLRRKDVINKRFNNESEK